MLFPIFLSHDWEGSLELKLLREPLVYFLIIDAATYLLYGVFAEPAQEEANKTILVSASVRFHSFSVDLGDMN